MGRHLQDLRDSISTRLVAVTLGAVVLTGLAIGFTFEQGRRDALVRSELDAMGNTARLAALRMTDFLEHMAQETLFLAHTPPVQGIARAEAAGGLDPTDGSSAVIWKARLTEIFRSFLRHHADYYQIRYIGVADGGRELVRVVREGGELRRAAPRLKGHVEFFRRALRLPPGQVHLSDVEVGEAHGRAPESVPATVRAATAIRGAGGKPFGVIVINAHAGALLGEPAKLVGEHTEAYVVSGDGRYLYHPWREVILRPGTDPPARALLDFPELEGFVGPRARYEPGLQERVETRSGLAMRAIKVPVGAESSRFLAVLIAKPYDRVVASAEVALLQSLIVGALLIIGALSVAGGLAHRVTAPLKRITVAASRLAESGEDMALPAVHRGEVGQLVRAFRSMAGQVRARQQALESLNRDLESRVATRTEDLACTAEALQAQQRLLALIIDSIGDGVLVVDQNGALLMFNRSAWRLVGAAPIDGKVSTWLDKVGEWQAGATAGTANPLALALTGSTSEERELCVRDGGSVRWLSATGRPLRDERDVLRGAVLTVRDITERKRAEVERERSQALLRESERRFRLLAEHIEEVFWICSADGRRVEYVSPAYQKLLGRDPAALGERPTDWMRAIHPADLLQVRSAFAVREPDGSYAVEFRIRRDGMDRWIRNRGFPVTDHEGTVVRIVGIARDVTEAKAAEVHAYNLAHYDALTGVANRLLFEDRLSRAVRRALRHDRCFCILFLDLDRFKQINDTLGHDAGDVLLREVAGRLRDTLRATDTVARLGGDEFAVILEDASEADADGYAARVARALAEPVVIAGGDSLTIGASIGMSVFPRDGVTGDQLLKNADIAMYQVKRAGRNALGGYDAPVTGAPGADGDDTPREGAQPKSSRMA